MVICNWYFRVSTNFLLLFFVTMHMSLFKSRYCYVNYCQVGNYVIVACMFVCVCVWGLGTLEMGGMGISSSEPWLLGRFCLSWHVHCEGFPCSSYNLLSRAFNCIESKYMLLFSGSAKEYIACFPVSANLITSFLCSPFFGKMCAQECFRSLPYNRGWAIIVWLHMSKVSSAVCTLTF